MQRPAASGPTPSNPTLTTPAVAVRPKANGNARGRPAQGQVGACANISNATTTSGGNNRKRHSVSLASRIATTTASLVGATRCTPAGDSGNQRCKAGRTTNTAKAV